MVKARASILIDRPPEVVFDFIAVDFARNYRRWSPEVQHLELLTPGPLRVGSRARQVRVDRGRRSDSIFEVVAWEPPDLVGFAERSGVFLIEYRLDPVAGRTRLSFRFELTRLELPMRPFMKLIGLAVQDGAERTVHNIKGLLETETPTAGTASSELRANPEQDIP